MENYQKTLTVKLEKTDNKLIIWINDKQLFNPGFLFSDSSIIRSTTSFEEIISMYNDLRENYEYYLQYEIAGKFFKKIMEYQKNYEVIQLENEDEITKEYVKKNQILANTSMHGLYKLLSDYGEDPYRPIITGVLIIAFSSVLLYLNDHFINLLGCLVNVSIGTINCITHSYWDHLIRVVSDFFPFFGFSREDPTMVDIGIKASGFVVFGLLFVSLRRKFERRFRH